MHCPNTNKWYNSKKIIPLYNLMIQSLFPSIMQNNMLAKYDEGLSWKTQTE